MLCGGSFLNMALRGTVWHCMAIRDWDGWDGWDGWDSWKLHLLRWFGLFAKVFAKVFAEVFAEVFA